MVREASRRAIELAGRGDAARGRSRPPASSASRASTRGRSRLRIREHGAMRAAVSTDGPRPASLVARVREPPGMEGADLPPTVSTPEPYEAARSSVRPADRGRVLRVAAYDFGMKRNILRLAGARTASRRRSSRPRRPPPRSRRAASTASSCRTAPAIRRRPPTASRRPRELLGKVPVFGICLGPPAARRWRSAGARTRCRSATAA